MLCERQSVVSISDMRRRSGAERMEQATIMRAVLARGHAASQHELFL